MSGFKGDASSAGSGSDYQCRSTHFQMPPFPGDVIHPSTGPLMGLGRPHESISHASPLIVGFCPKQLTPMVSRAHPELYHVHAQERVHLEYSTVSQPSTCEYRSDRTPDPA